MLKVVDASINVREDARVKGLEPETEMIVDAVERKVERGSRVSDGEKLSRKRADKDRSRGKVTEAPRLLKDEGRSRTKQVVRRPPPKPPEPPDPGSRAATFPQLQKTPTKRSTTRMGSGLMERACFNFASVGKVLHERREEWEFGKLKTSLNLFGQAQGNITIWADPTLSTIYFKTIGVLTTGRC